MGGRDSDYSHMILFSEYIFRLFAWKATWGKVLMLDQLKHSGMTFVNRCFLCEEDKETINHLLIHCKSAKILWNLFLSIVGTSWVFPHPVLHTLLAWQRVSVVKAQKKYK